MAELPVITGKYLVSLLEKQGFIVLRIRGSHYRMKHPDGRYTTVPVHNNVDLPKGLLRKIIREDLEMDIDDFIIRYL
ncbi:MAG TPA: type II toxin-antitoxin system HicA family toxin [Bacteroidales bacterium]|nr:type II toxin-antitoxin system HicA family toxin [Bacteroidales bacterium]HRZ76468.1 type II toxin-antitoxin system HicA family toxin [Bacteroidales bacterium]